MNMPEELLILGVLRINLASSPLPWYRLNKGIVTACFNFLGIIKHQTMEDLRK
jgi:hypothetical protein